MNLTDAMLNKRCQIQKILHSVVQFVWSLPIGKANDDNKSQKYGYYWDSYKVQGNIISAGNVLSVHLCTRVNISRCTFQICVLYCMHVIH